MAQAQRSELANRSDNGPEYISSTPISNATVRYGWLSYYLFESIGEVQDYATDWMRTCNHERPTWRSATSPQNRS